MNIIERTARLKSAFSLEKTSQMEDTAIEMVPIPFHYEMGMESIAQLQSTIPVTEFCSERDSAIPENKDFQYVVFNPKGKRGAEHAILLLHGLNERSWDKYLTWAETLALKCNTPVILFPIAFHMNRTPCNWSAPRWIMPWASKRKDEIAGLSNCSYFNTALSSRLSLSPERFYISGRESLYNIWQLMLEIRAGKHTFFSENCAVDIFAYSIGALLSQVVLIANPDDLFSQTKLFTFCGGSIFEEMNGNAKDIMDQEAFQKIHDYYMKSFLDSSIVGDDIERAFKAMISVGYMQKERESFFTKASSRIKMLLLRNDSVIPVSGAMKAVGVGNGARMVEEMDFPYHYTHQMPFPMTQTQDADLADICFRSVFDKAAAFLCV